MSARDELGNPITQQRWEAVLVQLEEACTKAREVGSYAEQLREALAAVYPFSQVDVRRGPAYPGWVRSQKLADAALAANPLRGAESTVDPASIGPITVAGVVTKELEAEARGNGVFTLPPLVEFVWIENMAKKPPEGLSVVIEHADGERRWAVWTGFSWKCEGPANHTRIMRWGRAASVPSQSSQPEQS